jgi:hypothetical protein
MAEWQVEPTGNELGLFRIRDPAGRKIGIAWRPTSPACTGAVAFLLPRLDEGYESGLYLDAEGSAFRGNTPHGPPGEYGWLLDLLRERTGLPWTLEGEGVKV